MAVKHVKTNVSERRGGSPVAHLVAEDGHAHSLHYTPETSSLGGVGAEFAQISRQGLKPLVRLDRLKVRTLSFTHTLNSVHLGAGLAALRDLIAVADTPIKYRLVNFASPEAAGWWYVIDLGVNITERLPNQQVKTAELTWSLVESHDLRPRPAHTPPKPKPRKPPARDAGPPLQGDHVVVRGDCLWSLAYQLLGRGSRWREIYELNVKKLHLAPPVMYRGLLTVWIYPGQRLKIPAR